MDLYAEHILDHYHHPLGKGKLATPTVVHEERNESCGDDLAIELTVEGDIIMAVRWQGEGCAVSQAAMSMLSEKLEHMRTEDAAALKPNDIREMLRVPIGPRRTKCALLSLHALKNALLKLHHKPSQSWAETLGE
ncbi:Fe-S cluster protein [Candidatus Peregrinibacteria bacterium CG10_big_fil_rev_8_21_14_0_10_55_24]|nr:MAG: Fe-S cluster protein [Candidatus Peregrinibacteria bacterium CG10_big_fil_rev_8_21_14_0_10_55_24]